MVWLQEIAWWKRDIAARLRTAKTSSDSTDRRERWFICSATAAAAVCIAGVVVVNAAWANLRKRWCTTNHKHGDQSESDIDMDVLAVYLRGPRSDSTAIRTPPPLLLCAALESEPAPLAAQVPPSMPAVSLAGLATAGGFPLSLPLFVTVNGVSGAVSVLSEPPAPAAPLLLLCAEAKEERVALVLVPGRPGTAVASPALGGGEKEAPTPPVPFPVVFLCCVLTEMASLRQPRWPAPMPVLSLSSLATSDGLLSLNFPLAVGGMDDTTEELSILMDPSARGTDYSPPLLCGEGNGAGGVLRAAAVSSRGAERVSSSPVAALSRTRKALWNLPINNSQPRSSSTSSKQSWGTPSTAKGKKGSCDENNDAFGSGGNRFNNLSSSSNGSGAGGRSSRIPVRDANCDGAAPATKTDDPPGSTLWSLPGQSRSAAPGPARGRSSVRSSNWALGKARRGSTSPEVVRKPSVGSSSNGGGGGGGGSAAWALGKARRGSTSPEAPAAERRRSSVRSPTWALGKARRGSNSPEVVRRPAPPRHEKGPSIGGNGGGSASRGGRAVDGVRIEAKGKKNAVSSSASLRSILVVTGSGSAASPRRAAAVARGVRWLDLHQKEEEQARNRRQRASRWMGNGGGGKKDGPQKARN